MVVDAGACLAMAHPLWHHLGAHCRSSPLEDLAPVLLGEVDCVNQTSEEPHLHIRSEVEKENGAVVVDVVWALWGTSLGINLCRGRNLPRCDACYLDAIWENGCVT